MGILDLFRQIESTPPRTSKISWIIAGLGNPGMTYEKTRHNAGFMTLDRLAEQCGGRIDNPRFRADTADAMVDSTRVLLVKPTTFMNSSGESVAAAADYYKIAPEHVLVIYDDITLPPGKIRIRPKGSAGGHNGMKSIIACLGSDNFPRIRLGIGAKPRPEMDLADWVLSKFTPDDLEKLSGAIENACAAVRLVLLGDTDSAMNRYN